VSESTHPVEVPTLKPRPRRRRRWLLALGAVLVFSATFAGWKVTHRAVKTIDPALVVSATRTSLQVEVVDVGRIEAVDTVEIESRIPGRVLQVLVDEGDAVKAGQPLVRLDRREAQRAVARASTELARARARAAFADKAAERQARGAAQGLVTQVERDLARQEHGLAVLDEKLARVALGEARDQLKYAEITSPIAGTVTRRAIEPGEMVKPGVQSSFESVALLTIADLSRLIVKTELNQIDVAKVKLGQRVSLSLDALPGEKFAARVTRIAPASVRPAGKDVEVFPVEAELEQADARIKPGMTADVRVFVRERPNVLALPLESVRREGDQSFVTRVVHDAAGERTERVSVTLGAENDHQVEVTGGIGEGDQVLIDPKSARDNETKI